MNSPKATKELKTKGNDKKLNALPKVVYFFRVIGMGLGGLAVASVFIENNAPPSSWTWIVFCCYIWPHLAYFRAKNHQSPFKAEQTNLLIDSFIAGTSASLIHFNLLPSVLLISIATADKVNSGVPGLWQKGLPLTILGAILCSLFTGFAFQPITSFSVVMASLPVAVIHTLLVSMYSYKLIIKLQSQNRKLIHLSQIDSLTGIYNRRQWQHLTKQLMQLNLTTKKPTTLLLIDIDHFKQINDQFGHITGDDVLTEVAKQLQLITGKNAIIGRLGGDEFAVISSTSFEQAKVLASDINHMVRNIKVPEADNLKCSSSIGMADLKNAEGDLRKWIEAADRMLYKAKSSGRDQFAH